MPFRTVVIWTSLAGAGSMPSACAGAQQSAQPEGTCLVGQISDGDSFRCADGRRVRLIGVDSPELQQRPYGASARNALSALLPTGSTVRLETDLAPRDQYGRTLAYVWADSTLVNEAALRQGWAVLYTVPPNVKYAERLTQAQKEARARGTGLWGESGFRCLPSDFRRKRCS